MVLVPKAVEEFSKVKFIEQGSEVVQILLVFTFIDLKSKVLYIIPIIISNDFILETIPVL